MIFLFDNLPAKWQDFDFGKFSSDKTLFDFQRQGLQNALKALWLYYKDKNGKKADLYSHYKANDFEETLNYDLKKKAEGKTAKFLLEYDEDYPVINSEISFEHFINRMSFWMATGSGKTLIIVKLIELLGRLIGGKELPARDILFLAHRDDLLDQFKNHVEEFNSFNFETKINLKNLRDYESVKRENALHLAKNEITVFYYRSDLISDEHKEKIVNFRNYDNDGKWYILLDEAHKGATKTASGKFYTPFFHEMVFCLIFPPLLPIRETLQPAPLTSTFRDSWKKDMVSIFIYPPPRLARFAAELIFLQLTNKRLF